MIIVEIRYWVLAGIDLSSLRFSVSCLPPMISKSRRVLEKSKSKLDFGSNITVTLMTHVLYIVKEIKIAETVVAVSKLVI